MKSNKHVKRQARQLFRFCLVDDLLDEDRTRQVVEHVARAGYRDCPAILAHFLRWVKLDRARHTANVESAIPLPPDLRDAIRSDLARHYGKGLTTTFVQRPSLIGGMRVQVGSDVYDGSVLAGLAALENSF